MSSDAVRHSGQYPCVLTDDPATRQHGVRSQYEQCHRRSGGKIQGEIPAVNKSESSDELVRRQRIGRCSDGDNLLRRISDRNATSQNSSARFASRRHTVEGSAACRRCSENHEDDHGFVYEPGTAGGHHTSDQSLPLNLSLRRTVSDSTPRGRDSPVAELVRRSAVNSGTELPLSYTATRETRPARGQKLIVGDKIHDIVTIGHGLWLLSD